MIAYWTIEPKNERIALATLPFAICRNVATFLLIEGDCGELLGDISPDRRRRTN
jgi:hypothetical protein